MNMDCVDPNHKMLMYVISKTKSIWRISYVNVIHIAVTEEEVRFNVVFMFEV